MLGSAITSADALKFISMEINPLAGTRVQRALIKGYMGADRQPLTNEHVGVTITFEWAAVVLRPQRRDSRRCCWPAA